jgi:uncharacterized metal-binding protein
MAVQCAQCGVYACRSGSIDAVPETCPMQGGAFPGFEELYGSKDQRRLAYESARIEAEGYCRWTRIREVLEFSRRMGFERLGIAHCVDTTGLAERAAGYFSGAGLVTFVPPHSGSCDPQGQAEYLARLATDLNVICGMALAHEAVFVRESLAPVTALVARDARLRHNPVAALYTSNSYYRSALFERHRGYEERPYLGAGNEVLERIDHEIQREGADDWCRVEEALEVAHRLGATHVGVTFCVGFRNEADRLVRVFEANGFRVTSACCKTGAVPKERLGIQDSEKVTPGQPEMICNPIAQAELLNREGVEMAFLLGQCVGHDTATMAHLHSPAACLVVKDRVMAHNTAAALEEPHD